MNEEGPGQQASQVLPMTATDGRSAGAGHQETRPRRSSLVRHLVFLAVAVLLAIVAARSYVGLPQALNISQQCRMSRMWPSYVLHTFDSPSGLGRKYSLYLYRESPPLNPGQQLRPSKRHRPALFIPGNAGSYGQIRSVASWARRDYEARIAGHGDEALVWETDWWTLDFNEDFSALHAPTLESQAIYVNEVLRYLVSYYQDEGMTSLPILAHSMGGIVARLARRIPNAQDNAVVKTIITLSTPHAVPPAPIEQGLEQIYSTINQKDGHEDDVLLVSLSGGVLDTQLPSEYTSLAGGNSSANVLQGYTADLPGLWSSCDHLAMMWCDQLRRKLSWTIAEEISGTGQGKDLLQRRQMWNDALRLPSGDHGEAQRDNTWLLSHWIKDSPAIVVSAGEEFRDYPVPQTSPALSDRASFQLLTDLPLGEDPKLAPGSPSQDRQLHVFVCHPKSKAMPTDGDGDQSICQPLPTWAFTVLMPPSPTDKTWSDFPHAEALYDQPGNSMRLLTLSSAEMLRQGLSSVKVVRTGSAAGFWRAKWSQDNQRRTVSMEQTSSKAGFDLEDGHSGDIVQRIKLDGFGSSLFVYDLIVQSQCSTQSSPAFAPMLHAFSAETGDGRWLPSLPLSMPGASVRLPLHLHTTSPFISSPSPLRRGISLDLVSDPAAYGSGCKPFGSIVLKVRWWDSIGLWVARYRWGLLAWTQAVFAALMIWAFPAAPLLGSAQSGSEAKYPEASYRIPSLLLTKVVSPSGLMVPLVLPVMVLSLFKHLTWPHPDLRDLLFSIDGHTTTQIRAAAFEIMLGFALLAFSWLLLLAVTLALTVFVWAGVLAAHLTHLERWLAYDRRPHAQALQWRKSTLSLLLILCLAIKFAVPYQFVLVAAVLVQFVNTVRAATLVRNQHGHAAAQQRLLWNSLALLHLFLNLPLKAPTILVFVRNFLAGSAFAAPPAGSANFGEDHDLWRIVPVLALVQLLGSGRTPEWQPPSLAKVTSATASHLWRLIPVSYVALSSYAVSWGIRYPWRLYDLSVLCWTALLLVHYTRRWGGSQREVPSDEDVPLATMQEREEEAEVERHVHRRLEAGKMRAVVMPSFEPSSSLPSEERQETDHGNENQAPDVAKTDDDGRTTSLHNAGELVQAASLELDGLLEQYLESLDQYVSSRKMISATLQQAFFALSSAQMGGTEAGGMGGWGATSGASVRSQRLREQPRRAELVVRLDEQGIFRLARVDPSDWRDEVEEETAGDPIEQSIADEKTTSTATATLDHQLRRRRNAPPSEKVDPSREGQVSEKRKPTTTASASSKSDSNQPAAKEQRRPPPSSLTLYAPLPSANVRKAQRLFDRALRQIVCGEVTRIDAGAGAGAHSSSKEEDEKAMDRDDGTDEVEMEGAVSLVMRMHRLEGEIELSRQKKERVMEAEKSHSR
ncbi:unnamed protein product [Jaminaea pallidilutea]